MEAATVVGKPAATVMTSSPGTSLLSPSRGVMSAAVASRLALLPLFRRRACGSPYHFPAKGLLETPARSPTESHRRLVDAQSQHGGFVNGRRRIHFCGRATSPCSDDLGHELPDRPRPAQIGAEIPSIAESLRVRG